MKIIDADISNLITERMPEPIEEVELLTRELRSKIDDNRDRSRRSMANIPTKQISPDRRTNPFGAHPL